NAGGSTRSLLSVISNLWAIPWMTFNPITIINANKGVMGVNMGRTWNDAPRLKTWLTKLLDLWSTGIVRPHVHAAVPFSNAPEAHRLLHARENIGKVVLVP